MEPVYLFDLVGAKRDWLAARQALVAQNVANANTPAYRTQDLAPFAMALDRSALAMTSDNPMHLQTALSPAPRAASKESEGWEVVHSGNSVGLEQEMMKQSSIRGAYSLDTSILKAFHNMWMSSLKG